MVVETSSDRGNYGSRSNHLIGSRAIQLAQHRAQASEKLHFASASWWGHREGTWCAVEPVGYEPNPNAALKPCQAATSLSAVDKNIKFRRLLVLKMYNMGPMVKAKKNKLRRRMVYWIGFWRT